MNEYFPFTIRAVDARKDILQVPDLIETCFHQWLDPDGAKFIHKMKAEATKVRKHPMLSRLFSTPYAIDGVVCETDDGRIIGHVSLFNVYIDEVYNNLIANVCVHPEFRHHGIARHMMDEALSQARRKGACKVYLQVREETHGAINMYRALGFVETHKRTCWLHPKSRIIEHVENDDMYIRRALFRERKQLAESFSINYPDSLLWNTSFSSALFRCGLFFDVLRKVQMPEDELLAICDEQGNALGWFAHQHSHTFADTLWFMPTEGIAEEKLGPMLRIITRRYQKERPIMINIPGTAYADALKSAGYFVHNRLRWMKKAI